MGRTVSRRSVLRAVGSVGAAGGLAAGLSTVSGCADAGESAGPRDVASVFGASPFHGVHQAGIEQAQQRSLLFTAFDMVSADRGDLVALLKTWTAASERLVAGDPVTGDSDEVLALGPSLLTLTFGFGPTLFDERFGLGPLLPSGFGPLPAFPGDRLDPARSYGDLMVQACADDPQVTFHAARQLTRLAGSVATVRWQQAGFGEPAAINLEQTTRNLLGFKDGTANPTLGSVAFDKTVWVGSGGPVPMRGGTYLCVRPIRIDLDKWDDQTVGDQQVVIGRDKVSGAPLSGGTERTAMDFSALGPGGAPAIASDSHVRLADADFNGGATMFRRGYNYDNGYDDATGVHDAGRFFLAYVADIPSQFLPIQQRLAANDRMNSFITHVASATFAVPPGVRRGGWVGEGFFSSIG